jgi:hypothetical protein
MIGGFNLKQLLSAKKMIVILITLVLLISIITWVYPYSSLSVYKNYSYNKGLVLVNGKTHEEIVQKFKRRLEFDLEEKEQNRTVSYTQNILPLFEQDWYIKEDAVTIKKQDLETMLMHVKNTRSTLLSLLQHEEYTSEQKMYLEQLINGFLGIEEYIGYMQHEPFLSRGDIRRSLGNLRDSQGLLFSIFTTFYDLALRNV